uniref:Uncharacterized protein n=1 Tax=Triticum urartu TaxID=4572 RepID=A0A8R7U0T8_TRIUA
MRDEVSFCCSPSNSSITQIKHYYSKDAELTCSSFLEELIS